MSRSLCIVVAANERPLALRRLLTSLAEVERPSGLRIDLRVVDRASLRPAKSVVDGLAWDGDARYEQIGGATLARALNRALDMGPADLFAFLDETQVVRPSWLASLMKVLDDTNVDGVFGPIVAEFHDDAPAWIRDSTVFERTTGADTTIFDWEHARASNVLLRGVWFHPLGFRFDESITPRELADVELFQRLRECRARFVAAASAPVIESIDASGISPRELLAERFGAGKLVRRIDSDRPSALTGLHPAPLAVLEGFVTSLAGLPHLLVGRSVRCFDGLARLAFALGRMSERPRPALDARQVARGYSSVRDLARPTANRRRVG